MFAGGQDQANRLRLIVAASLTNGSRRHRCACRVPEVGTRGRSAMISVLGQSIMITRRDHRRVAPAVEPDLPADAWMGPADGPQGRHHERRAAGVAAGGHRAPPHQRDTRAGLLVQMLVHRSWTSRPVAGTVGPVMRIDGHAALTLPQAARWLGLTVPCVNALIARGELASLRDPDGSVRISAASLIEWAGTAGRGDPPPAPQ